mmetsp:Transcript_46171/g.53947  ORF Transcript_46171/g.53947 Transcript_46171/m.53947 type:complete len:401 (+) Transcript_46171:48-1250(+)
MIRFLLLVLTVRCSRALKINEPQLTRREIFSVTAATAVSASSLLTPLLPVARAASDAPESYEKIIPQETLLSGLTTSPVRNIIITGANSGVGLAGAKLLTASGHRVILACRTQAKADAAAAKCMAYAATSGDSFYPSRRSGGEAVGAECDLASLSSVRAFAKSMKDSQLDTLVLNAGLAHGQADKEPFRTMDGFEETVGVNHLGHFLLADLIAPILAKSSSAPRIVSTASPVHDPNSGGGNVGRTASLGNLAGMSNDGASFAMVDGGPYDPDKAYKDSKLCNILFMAEAARRYKGKITVNAFSPGLIADPNGFFRNQSRLFATVFNSITKIVGVAETNEFGGSGLAYMAADASMDGLTGGWYDSVPVGKHQLAKHAPSVEAQNIDEQKSLWTLSAKLVGA